VKTKNGAVSCNVTDVGDGVRFDARFHETKGYIYLRQIRGNIKAFEGKKWKLKVAFEKISWQNISYDIYISSRYSSNDADRVTVVDTQDKQVPNGLTNIEVTFDVPVHTDIPMDSINGLSVSFRIIGQNQNTAFIVHSMTLEEVTDGSTPPPTDDCQVYKDKLARIEAIINE